MTSRIAAIALLWAFGALAGCGGDPAAQPGTAADTAAGPDAVVDTEVAVGGDAALDSGAGDADAGPQGADTAPQDALETTGEVQDAGPAGSEVWTGGGACPAAAEPACGGQLEGTTWTVVDFCPEDPTAAAALFEHPYDNLPACQPPGGTVKGQLVDTGEISFADGQMLMNFGGYAETTYTFSPACLQAVKPGLDPAAACTAMSKPDIMTCQFGPDAVAGNLCTCLAKVPKEGGKEQAPYAIVGGKTLKISTEISAAYCVQGDRLLLDVSPHIVSWRWWLFKRKP